MLSDIRTKPAVVLLTFLFFLVEMQGFAMAFSCAGQADGFYCSDSSKFNWCSGGAVVASMSCSPGTVCSCAYSQFSPCMFSGQQLPAGCTAVPTTSQAPTATPVPTPTSSGAPEPTPTATAKPTPTDSSCQQKATNCAVNLPSLMFHYVETPATHDAEYTVDTAFFLEILAWIKQNGYTPVTLAQVYDALMNSGTLPCKPIHLRFDDGYRGQQFVVDNLRTNNMIGTFFISSSLMNDGTDGQYLTSAQLTDWASDMEIADHTRYHDDLITLTSDEVQDNTCGSMTDLGTMIGKTVRMFAYPFGSYDDTVESVTSQCCDMALSVNYGIQWSCNTLWEQPTIDMKYIKTIAQLETAVAGNCVEC